MGHNKTQKTWIKDNYKTITIRFTNESGQTVGYKNYSVPKKQEVSARDLAWYVKNWNEKTCFALEANKAELVEPKQEKPKVTAIQLTLF